LQMLVKLREGDLHGRYVAMLFFYVGRI